MIIFIVYDNRDDCQPKIKGFLTKDKAINYFNLLLKRAKEETNSSIFEVLACVGWQEIRVVEK